MPASENISVSVKLEVEDYIAFDKTMRSLQVRWRILIYTIVFGGLLFYNLYQSRELLDTNPEFIFYPFIPIVLIVMIVFIGAYARKRKIIKMFENDPTFRIAYVYDFGDSEINVNSTTSNAKYFWGDIFQVRESKGHFFVFVAMNKALIIPKRDLYDENIIQQFKNLITKNIIDPKKIKFL